MFHVLLRRLTPRHPPYALSSFLLPDAERFYFHFSPARPSSTTTTPASLHVSSFSSLCSWKGAGCGHQARSRGRASLPFRRCPPSAGPERIQAQRSGAKPEVWPPSVIFVSIVLPHSAKQPGTSPGCRKSAYRSVGKKLFSSGGVSSQQVLVCPERMKFVEGISTTEEWQEGDRDNAVWSIELAS